MEKFQKVEDKYMWETPGEGIYDIEKCKSIAKNTTLLSSDNEIQFPDWIQYQDLVFGDSDTKRRFEHYKEKASKELNCSLEEAENLYHRALRIRAYKGFYGESSFSLIVNKLDGISFEESERIVDATMKIDGILRAKDGRKKAISIKTISSLNNSKGRMKVAKEKVTHEQEELEVVYVFHSLGQGLPYLSTENHVLFRMGRMKVDFDKLREFVDKLLE
ncbi:hypothetical protein [Bacillus wiedmannii]|uniref:hypothetical protein n=1 Tax=Bacillus wiedmannii TaxID=1890302 RepID=UPI000BFD86A1|nr:hypothetical protein [Bacillus wiedmannii]PHE70586.1 hypothetical protein COF77_25575 [Bacillus wiedmannii]